MPHLRHAHAAGGGQEVRFPGGLGCGRRLGVVGCCWVLCAAGKNEKWARTTPTHPPTYPPRRPSLTNVVAHEIAHSWTVGQALAAL